ncbi:histidine kinase [Streptomyces sp. ISL-22]|uniref:sensor histidine kinase n=1 Tax=Streptomyces sp. ISL-22 TaxID=2819180 RepID=UPI0027E3A72B|nr:histidine kinase [Streptomyces sp. ISL-22]
MKGETKSRPLWITFGPVVAAAADAAVATAPMSPAPWAASYVAVAALLGRLRTPLSVLLITWPGVFMGSSWLAGLIALYTVARLRSDRRLLVLCTLLVATGNFLPYPLSMGDLAYRATDFSSIENAVGTAMAAAALGRAIALRSELAARLHELTEGRAREHRLLSEQVLAAERAQLAREMHDVVAHQVSLISLQAGALRTNTTDPATKDTANTIRTLAVRTLDELRHMVGVLRAAGGTSGELTPQPRLTDLPRLISESELDIDAEIDEQACTRCHETVERAAFRIVQEALTNVRKHAPGAKVQVRVRQENDELQVEIHNGPADPAAVPLQLPSGGHGLVGLSERVHLLGGFFTAGPRADGGFVVTATLPTDMPLITQPSTRG